jgi:hypothetical protein
MAVTATRCTAAQIEGRAGWRCRSDLDWIEWQATSIAPRILMPKDSFERAAMKSCADHKGQFHSNKAYFHQVVTDIVDIFHVSRESAAIRIKETGYMRRFQ